MIGFEFRGISRYKFKLRFLFNLNLQLTKISPPFLRLIGLRREKENYIKKLKPGVSTRIIEHYIQLGREEYILAAQLMMFFLVEL